MTTKIYYRIGHNFDGLSSKIFPTQEHAQAEIEHNRDGCPFNKMMSDENRQYWRELGKEMYIEKVTETVEVIKY